MHKIAGLIRRRSRERERAAHAQTYPTREIRLIVGLPAGSGGDINARYYADKLSQLAGKPVIVENRPGMILSIGADAVAKAPPDGHTVLITSVTSSHAANVFNFKKLPYDPIKDFTPVAMLQRSYFMLMVRPDAPWTSVAELTAAMKIKGDKASYGYGAPPALASAELYKARAGLKAVGIPYKSSVGSLSEMLSGEIDFQFIDSTAGTPLREGGKLRGARGHLRPARAGRRSAHHGRGRRHPRVRHRAGLGRAAAGGSARARSSRAWKRGSPRSAGWTPPGSFSPTPVPRRSPAAPGTCRSSFRRRSRSGGSWPRSRGSSRSDARRRHLPSRRTMRPIGSGAFPLRRCARRLRRAASGQRCGYGAAEQSEQGEHVGPACAAAIEAVELDLDASGGGYGKGWLPC